MAPVQGDADRRREPHDPLLPPPACGRVRADPAPGGAAPAYPRGAPGADKPIIRTYTISVAPSDAVYRISVKRDGTVSTHLHDTLRVGDVVEARAPAGVFTIDAHAKRPAVLLAGGIGITPLLAMLRHVVYEGLRTRGIRPTFLIQAARSKEERPFDREVAELADAAQGAVRVVRC